MTCPPGYETGEAASYSFRVGSDRAHRVQVIHGENKGMAGSFKKLSLRVDRFPVGTTSLLGRKWSSVVLKMAEGPLDYATTNATFTKNHLTTPTTVFSSSAVHWPATSGGYGMDPVPWGQPTGLAFPFRSTWLYTGIRGVCADFDFRGGTLDNGQAWTKAESYYLDAVPRYTAGGGGYRLYGDQNCKATGRATESSFHPDIATYADDYPRYSDKFRYVFEYSGLPASAASTGAVLAVSTNGSTTGTRILSSCNKLHIDLNQAFLTTAFTPNSTGRGKAPFSTHQLFAYSPAFAGLDIWSQVAFTDGSPATFQLTMAGRNRTWRLPNKNRACVFSLGTTAGVTNADLVPVLLLHQ